MPIYEYQCSSCGHSFDKLVKMGAEAPPCPECGAEVQKKVSAAGFILKGGGWYKDHYGLKSGDGKSSDAKSSDAKPSDGGAKSDGGGKSDGGAAKSDSAASSAAKSIAAKAAKPASST